MCCIATLWQAQTERNVRFSDISLRKGFYFYIYTSSWWNNADFLIHLLLNLWIWGKYLVENQNSSNLFLHTGMCNFPNIQLIWNLGIKVGFFRFIVYGAAHHNQRILFIKFVILTNILFLIFPLFLIIVCFMYFLHFPQLRRNFLI